MSIEKEIKNYLNKIKEICGEDYCKETINLLNELKEIEELNIRLKKLSGINESFSEELINKKLYTKVKIIHNYVYALNISFKDAGLIKTDLADSIDYKKLFGIMNEELNRLGMPSKKEILNELLNSRIINEKTYQKYINEKLNLENLIERISNDELISKSTLQTIVKEKQTRNRNIILYNVSIEAISRDIVSKLKARNKKWLKNKTKYIKALVEPLLSEYIEIESDKMLFNYEVTSIDNLLYVIFINKKLEEFFNRFFVNDEITNDVEIQLEILKEITKPEPINIFLQDVDKFLENKEYIIKTISNKQKLKGYKDNLTELLAFAFSYHIGIKPGITNEEYKNIINKKMTKKEFLEHSNKILSIVMHENILKVISKYGANDEAIDVSGRKIYVQDSVYDYNRNIKDVTSQFIGKGSFSYFEDYVMKILRIFTSKYKQIIINKMKKSTHYKDIKNLLNDYCKSAYLLYNNFREIISSEENTWNYNLFGNPELTELAKLLSIEKLDQAKIIPYEEAISKEEGVKNALKAVLDNYLTGSSFNKEIFFGKIGIDQILLQNFESALKLKDTKKISDKLVESMFAYRSRKLIRRH